LRCFFIESVCDDERIIDSNITDVKVNSPDYKGLMSAEQAKEDFLKRIENYKQQYQPIDEVEDEALSFIKVINAGRSFFVHNVQGHVQSRVVYFLDEHVIFLQRSIFLTARSKASGVTNAWDALRGDPLLTARRVEKLPSVEVDFTRKQKFSDLRIWGWCVCVCSQKVPASMNFEHSMFCFPSKITFSRLHFHLMGYVLMKYIFCEFEVRAAQTAQKLKSAYHTEYWKALDEIDAGICEGLTYDDIQM
ncbi:6-phosphofructo-2-kinase, partial [Cooperia oncophora]